MAAAMQKPILISGAGISSLLLAQALLRAAIPFQIFERDASISFRAQGYRLRLSNEGLDAIESVLGPEKFQKFWDTCGKTGGGGFATLEAISGEKVTEPSSGPPQPQSKPQDTKNDDDKPKGAPKETLHSRDGKIVGIARGDMRRLFMEGCEPYVHWSHNVTGYETTPSGVHALFSNGTKSVEGSMLIGGEGIHSKVARQVSSGKIKTYDTGARGIHGQAPSTAFKDLGEGVWRITDETSQKPHGKVFAITNVRPGDLDDPTVQFGWTMGSTPGVISPPNNDYTIIGAPAAQIAKSLTSTWHPRIRALFDQMTESEAAFWKITCSSPSGVPLWSNNSRVTVIGDAVHSMTPAGGIGANTAVRDSALLGNLIADAKGWREGLTEEYEEKMRVYASEAVATSYGLATSQFGVLIDEATSPTV